MARAGGNWGMTSGYTFVSGKWSLLLSLFFLICFFVVDEHNIFILFISFYMVLKIEPSASHVLG